MWRKNVSTTFFRFVTAFDRQTNGQTDRQLSRG